MNIVNEIDNIDLLEILYMNIKMQFAWDKQATFMNSLSRSMAELRNMLKQYVEMTNYDDDRLLEIKRMTAAIEKTNAEIEVIQDDHVLQKKALND